MSALPTGTRPVFVPPLTPAEREIINHFALGMTYAEIASVLPASINTVKTHAQHAFVKLGVHDRRTAVYYVTGRPTIRNVEAAPVDDLLSVRQREVLAHVAAGMTNREIAEAMFISQNTVKTHLRRASKALGTRSRRAAVAAAETYDSDPKVA